MQERIENLRREIERLHKLLPACDPPIREQFQELAADMERHLAELQKRTSTVSRDASP